MNGSGLVMCIVFYVILHTSRICFIKVRLEYVAFERVKGLYALFFEILFFLFDQSGYQKHAGGFLWLFNASLYGLICIRNRNIFTLLNIKDLFLYFWNLNIKFRK